jgi:putative amide transporter protein
MSANGNQAQIIGGSGLFLFGFTYLYVAMNNAFNLDGTGLGWFCLFVVFAAVVYSVWNFTHSGALGPSVAAAHGNNAVGDLLGVLWGSWAVLWFLFWVVLSLGKEGFTRFTGAWCAAQGIYTGLVPAVFLLNIPSGVTKTFWIVIAAVSVGTFLMFWVLLRPSWTGEPAVSSEPGAPSVSSSYAGT